MQLTLCQGHSATGLKEKLTLKVGKIGVRKLFLEIWQKTERTCGPRNINWKSCLSVHDSNHNSFVFEVVGDVNILLKQILLNINYERNGKFYCKVWTYEFLKYSVCVVLSWAIQVKASMKI